MAEAIFWSNVQVDVQSALATSVKISAISTENPAVLTYDGGVAPADGDYIVISAQGMHQVSDRIFRVDNVDSTSKTFELDGLDATLFDPFVAGTFQVITFGASMRTAQTIEVSGGEPEYADVTTIHDTVRKRVPTVVSPLTLATDTIYDLTDPAFIELNKAYQAKTKRAIRLRFANGYRMLLSGYVAAAGVPTGQAQGVVQTRISIEAQNLPTVYAN